MPKIKKGSQRSKRKRNIQRFLNPKGGKVRPTGILMRKGSKIRVVKRGEASLIHNEFTDAPLTKAEVRKAAGEFMGYAEDWLEMHPMHEGSFIEYLREKGWPVNKSIIDALYGIKPEHP